MNGTKSTKSCSKNTNNNQAKLDANEKSHNYGADINDKYILQKIEGVLTRKFNKQEEILKVACVVKIKLFFID